MRRAGHADLAERLISERDGLRAAAHERGEGSEEITGWRWSAGRLAVAAARWRPLRTALMSAPRSHLVVGACAPADVIL